MKGLRRVLYLVPMLALLVVYIATQPRGIWVDEVLQFAPAAFPSLGQAANAIFESTHGVNHGQTGIHMLLNAAMLQHLGASYFVLRLPSYAAYVVGVAAGFFYLTDLGASLVVGLWFALLFGLSQLSLEHGWEARPYILLEGSVMAFLLFWRRYAMGRVGGLPMVLLCAVVGILFHPFFVAYAGMICLGGFLLIPEERAGLINKFRSKRALAWALASAAGCIALFLVIGKLSWFSTQGHKMGLDPYTYIKHDKPLARFMVGTFFYPVSIAAVPAIALLTLLLLRFRRRPSAAPLVGPYFSLVVTVVVTQAVIAYSVIQSEYWILQRQWIAGNALSFLAAAILVDFFIRLLGVGRTLLDGLAFMTIVAGSILLGIGIHSHLSVPVVPTVPFAETDAYRQRLAAQKEISMNDYQGLAHQNLLVGGKVWPEFARYYEGLIRK